MLINRNAMPLHAFTPTLTDTRRKQGGLSVWSGGPSGLASVHSVCLSPIPSATACLLCLSARVATQSFMTVMVLPFKSPPLYCSTALCAASGFAKRTCTLPSY